MIRNINITDLPAHTYQGEDLENALKWYNSENVNGYTQTLVCGSMFIHWEKGLDVEGDPGISMSSANSKTCGNFKVNLMRNGLR